MKSFAPEVIDERYEVIRHVHPGTDFHVCKVKDQLTDQTLALKIETPGISRDVRNMFQEQFSRMRKCVHHGLVPVHSIGYDKVLETEYFTLQWQNAKTLDRFDSIELPDLLDLTLQICDCLGYIHRRGFIVSDLSPSHIFMIPKPDDHGHEIRLINYGIGLDTVPHKSITGKRSINSLAPELIQGDELDHRVDLYALGALLYEFITGRKLFHGTVGQIIKQHITTTPEPLDIHPEMDRIVAKLLSKNPDQRYLHMQELQADLKNSFSKTSRWVIPRMLYPIHEGMFIDRDLETLKLNTGLEKVVDSRQGYTIHIVGEKGIGKHRLLREWTAEKEPDGYSVLELPRDCSILKASDQWWDKENPLILVLDEPEPDGKHCQACLSQLGNLLVRHPILLCIVQDTDFPSEFISNLLRNLNSENSACLETLTLGALSPDDVTRLTSNILYQDPVPDEFMELLEYTACGNPEFIEHSIRNSMVREELSWIDGQWTFVPEKIPRLSLPDPIRKRLEHRLNRIPESYRSLIHFAGLVTDDISRETIGTFFPDHNIEDDLNYLIDTGILQKDDRDSGRQYNFTHHAFRDIIQETIPEDEKLRIHGKLADRMETLAWNPESIAHHRLLSHPSSPAVESIMNAAEYCIEKGFFSRAEHWIDSIKMDTEEIPDELEIRFNMVKCRILLMRHRNTEVLRMVTSVLDRLPVSKKNRMYRAHLHQYAAQSHLRFGDFDLANEEIEKSIEEIPGNSLPDIIEALLFQCRILVLQGRLDAANDIITLTRERREVDAPEDNAAFLNMIISEQASEILFHRGELVEAREMLLEALPTADSSAEVRHRIGLRLNLAIIAVVQSECDEAESLCQDIFSIIKTSGIKSEMAAVFRLRGEIALARSKLSNAREYLELSINTDRRWGRRLSVLRSQICLGEVLWKSGDFETAESVLNDVLNESRNMRYTLMEADVLTELGFVALEKSQYTPAIRFFQESLVLNRNAGRRIKTERSFYGLALLYWILNDRLRARQCVKKTITRATHIGNREILARVFLINSHIARFERNYMEGEQTLEKATTIFQDIPSENGIVTVQLFKLRMLIDRDLTDDVWKEGLRLYEEIRKSEHWRTRMDGSLIIAKLAERRNDHSRSDQLLNHIIGLARVKSCYEYLWRALRIRAQSLEDKGLYGVTLENLETAWSVITKVVDEIASPVLRKKYLNRSDVKAVRVTRDEMMARHRNMMEPGESFPSLADIIEYENRIHTRLSSERYRLFRREMRKIRETLSVVEIQDRITEVVLKLSGGDRGYLFTKDEHGQFKLTSSRIISEHMNLNLDSLLSSTLVEEVTSAKKLIFSANLMMDDRYNRDLFVKDVGIRAALCLPLRVRDGIIGVFYLDSRIGNSDFLAGNAGLVQEFLDESALIVENARLYFDLDASFMEMVRVLAIAIDEKDPYTRGHSVRVARHALKIGNEMGLNPGELRNLELAAFLHDIGKLGISQVILESDHELEPDEYEIMKDHPEIGFNILSPIKKFVDVTRAIRHHHERYDGKGYPDGLQGEEISMNARIIAVADALDAMTTDRPYRRAIPVNKAVYVIQANAGTQFDPIIAGALSRLNEINDQLT